ncbi:hypothetical protein HY085_03190 [Candidatus Gottesmanbacteria bacterium]|nr:hypothetical protein [Candidatus Gottesmanbacteria bacterium]
MVTVGLDLDHVIVNTIQGQAKYAETDILHVTDPQFKSLRQNFYQYPELVADLKPNHGALGSVSFLVENGLCPYVCSSRSISLREITLEWLKKYGFDKFITTGKVFLNQDKLEIARQKQALCLVDDDPDFCEAAIKDGFPVIRIKRPNFMQDLAISSSAGKQKMIVEVPSLLRGASLIVRES